MDRPGKDSWRAREAGAAAVLLSSDHRSALLTEHRDAPPSLADLLAQLPPCDLVLVEGYKREPIPKLEVHRAATGKPWLFPDDPHILAVASDIAPPQTFHRIDLDAIPALTDFILNHALSYPTA
jgi:molybdopterin-guanine dinucleotide biosynthesis protein B